MIRKLIFSLFLFTLPLTVFAGNSMYFGLGSYIMLGEDFEQFKDRYSLNLGFEWGLSDNLFLDSRIGLMTNSYEKSNTYYDVNNNPEHFNLEIVNYIPYFGLALRYRKVLPEDHVALVIAPEFFICYGVSLAEARYAYTSSELNRNYSDVASAFSYAYGVSGGIEFALGRNWDLGVYLGWNNIDMGNSMNEVYIDHIYFRPFDINTHSITGEIRIMKRFGKIKSDL